MAGIERRLKKIVDAIADGVCAKILKEELLRLAARQDELRELLMGPEPDRTLVHPGLAELYRRKVTALHEALDDENTREEAMELIRSLVEAIVLIPDAAGLRVEVRGDLAAILAFGEGTKNKNPRSTDQGSAKQIKMVAGVGFEPTTFRL
jgi:site-specific DNA recombinase